MSLGGKCDFKSEGEFCELCNEVIPKGQNIYFLPDGFIDPREGRYICKDCWNGNSNFDESLTNI